MYCMDNWVVNFSGHFLIFTRNIMRCQLKQLWLGLKLIEELG